MLKMNCPKCNIDPKPVLVGSGDHLVSIAPCGLVKNDTLQFVSLGCPMTEWQRGYADRLKDEYKTESPALPTEKVKS